MLSPAGWTYDAQGRVIRIPQYDPERPNPAEYRKPAYRCVARHGYAWVALEELIATIPELPEFGAPGWRTIFQFYKSWDTSPLRVLENSLDNAHFSFVHRATFGVAAPNGCSATTAKKSARRSCSSTSTTSSRAKTKTSSNRQTRTPWSTRAAAASSFQWTPTSPACSSAST